MVRRYRPSFNGKRYIGNSSPDKMQVHDLDNENTRGNGCQIDEIIKAGHVKIFNPDTLEQAYREGYGNCTKCIRDPKG